MASEATRRGFTYVGVIVPHGPGDQLAQAGSIDRVREQWPHGTNPAEPQLFVGVEAPWSEVSGLTELPNGIDYLVLRASPSLKGPPDSHLKHRTARTPWFVGHLNLSQPSSSSSADLVDGWIRWSRTAGVALEVTPDGSADGLDSRSIRLAVEAGGSLVISSGARSLGDFRDLDIAVGLARRGWAGPDRVLNTSARPSEGFARQARRSTRPGLDAAPS